MITTSVMYRVDREYPGEWFPRSSLTPSIESARAWRKMLQSTYRGDEFRIVEVTTSERTVE